MTSFSIFTLATPCTKLFKHCTEYLGNIVSSCICRPELVRRSQTAARFSVASLLDEEENTDELVGIPARHPVLLRAAPCSAIYVQHVVHIL